MKGQTVSRDEEYNAPPQRQGEIIQRQRTLHYHFKQTTKEISTSIMSDSLIGEQIDGYRIQEVLGHGGMGVVYKAEDVALSRVVAMKRVDPKLADDQAFLRRFRSEARALARIDSPYIVKIYTLRQTEIGLVIVMEYVEGRTLKQCIEPEGMNWREALPLIHQMLTAIDHAHGAGVVHRDIKPQNILLTDIVLAHGTRVKVTDFGLAKVNTSGDPSRTVTRNVYGSLNYMSPEQVKGNGQVDHRSDIYSMGMTIYEMLAGRLPFEEGSTEYTIMRTIVERDLPPLETFVSDIPQPIVDIVEKSIRKDPSRRFESAAAMQAAVERFNNSPAHDRVLLPTDDTEHARTSDDDDQDQSLATHSGSTDHSTKRYLGLVGILFILVLSGVYFYSPTLFGDGSKGESSSTTGTVVTSEETSTPERQSQSSATNTDLPPSIESLTTLSDAASLRRRLRDRVEAGLISIGTGPEQMSAPTNAYIFVVNRTSEEVEAVLGPGNQRRTNLLSMETISEWRTQYAGLLHIWAVPTDS